MNKIVVIGVYFGNFPIYMNLWEKSCSYNKDVDFIVFTDQNRESKEENIKYMPMSLKKLSELASEKLELEINIETPYKCCDFKCVYGVIFEDYIKDYDFWGHCDFDLIFGDIRAFITNDIMSNYDKILPLGHLCIYRNTEEVKKRYKASGSKTGNFKEVFTNNSKFYAFDEWNGMYSIYKEHNYPHYDKRIFADISMIYERFRLALKDKNYNNQVFFWEEGKTFRAFEENGEIKVEEFIYIHFKKRKNMNVFIADVENTNIFYITNKGFYSKHKGIPTLEEIKKYNKYNGKLYEWIELVKFDFKDKIERAKIKLKRD